MKCVLLCHGTNSALYCWYGIPKRMRELIFRLCFMHFVIWFIHAYAYILQYLMIKSRLFYSGNKIDLQILILYSLQFFQQIHLYIIISRINYFHSLSSLKNCEALDNLRLFVKSLASQQNRNLVRWQPWFPGCGIPLCQCNSAQGPQEQPSMQ